MDKTAKSNIIVLSSTIALLITCAICILLIGGTIAVIAVVLYCIMIAIGLLGILANIFNPETSGMQVGLVKEPDSKLTIDINRYDEFIRLYENRIFSIWFWLSIPVALSWPIVFLTGGFAKTAYASAIFFALGEIAKYQIYRTIKKNKDSWGTAAYINEINNFFNGKKKG